MAKLSDIIPEANDLEIKKRKSTPKNQEDTDKKTQGKRRRAWLDENDTKAYTAPTDEINLKKIDWVIVGGESGPNAREMKPEWAENIQYQCEEQNVAFFFKQWGGKNKKKTGRELNGKTYDDMPKIIEN